MGSIHLLDELTINKIAAGEVIERPASVIKEMVENSIDANATNITVEIKNGGISYIKITDNGKGIAQDDLEMAFERHATSKIRSAEDLDQVSSMGFRGEALASIAAISNVELISKTEEQQTGYKVVLEGGEVLKKEEIGCQTGTTITVQNLFFNTPVRYKFLKKDFTETGYIEDVITRIALINPQISFKLINTGKTILQTSGNGNIKDAIYSIYGKDVAEQILNVEYTYEDMKITGVIGKPEIARSNRSNQLFFVNKRYVKDKVLTAATEQAYKGMIDAGKFGFVVLNIEMPQTKVDVNVHPAKLEVRFAEESKVFQAIFHAIKDCLLKDYSSKETSTPVDNIIIQTRETNNTFKPNYEQADSFNSNSNTSNLNENVNNNLDNENNFNTEMKKSTEEKTEKSEKPRGLGFFSWKRNKNYFGEPSNIVEDLYNEKKESEFAAIHNNEEEKAKKDEIVNTSDVLKELKQINEHVQEEAIKAENTAKLNLAEINAAAKLANANGAVINNTESTKLNDGQNVEENKEEVVKEENKIEEIKVEENKAEQKDLPDGTTYTYVGENKEKIEDLLRQLHPEINNKPTETDFVALDTNQSSLPELKVAEETTQYNDVEEHIQNENVEEVKVNEATQKIEKPEQIEQNNQETQKFDLNNNIYNNYNEEKNNNEDITQNNNVENTANNSNPNMPNNADFELPKIFKNPNKKENTSNDFNQMYEKLFGTPVKDDNAEEIKKEQEKYNAVDLLKDNVSVFEGIPSMEKPTYKIIGDAFGEFIIVEIEKEMYIVNKQTAKEKVVLEQLKNNYYNQVNKESQMLLLPDIIELTNKQTEIINENLNILLQAGFSFEEFGENTLRLMGVPNNCMELDTKVLFLKVLENINTVPITAVQEKEEKILGTIAHELVLRNKEVETTEEINSLMEDLLQLKDPFTLDIEKPIAIKMSKYDIERKFSRK